MEEAITYAAWAVFLYIAIGAAVTVLALLLWGAFAWRFTRKDFFK